MVLICENQVHSRIDYEASLFSMKDVLSEKLVPFISRQNLEQRLGCEEVELAQIIDRVISTHRRFKLPKKLNDNVKFATNINDILSVMKLRSEIYTPLGYNCQFPEKIPGLNFDNYDANSLILMVVDEQRLVGSFRIVLDSKLGIPSEKMYDFDSIRVSHRIAELSRLVVTPSNRSGSSFRGSMAFNELFSWAYMIGDIIDVDRYVMIMKKAHESRFLKFGGVTCLGETQYGSLNQNSPMLLWDFNQCSEHFIDMILNYNSKKEAA